MDAKIIEFKIISDERGSLVALENNKNIPFDIKRVYYLYGIKDGSRRGFHAHKKLQQVLICVSGQCKILLDDGKDKKTVTLEAGNGAGLFIGNSIWREMFDFGEDAVLLVLADDFYDESDYIRDYQKFLEYYK